MQAQGSIYDSHPYLERTWSGVTVGRRKILEASAAWYADRLRSAPGPVCELACGYGRLLLPLARAGVPVHGCDASVGRIGAARELFARERLAGTFEVGRLPDVPEGAARFGAVILAWSSFAYATQLEDKRRLLDGIARALVPGGLLGLDYARGAWLIERLGFWPGLGGEVQQDGSTMRTYLTWDARSSCVCEHFVWRPRSGAVVRWEDRLGFCADDQTDRLLREHGLRVVERRGGFDDAPLRPWSRRCVLVARRETG
jgi:SAM-dependent methyltransferase